MRVNIYGRAIAAGLLVLLAPSAGAWSHQGHMVTGAIAYDEIQIKDPQVAARILDLMAQHPDRGSFSVAVDGATDEMRARRIFMEMARWPDDIRNGAYDHPTWHYAARPLIDAKHPPPSPPANRISGSALEALALNAAIVADTRAPAGDRAIALCWVFHLVGDIHQPLHAADRFSTRYPQGDRGGGLQYVIDPQTRRPLSLHWYWDQAVNRSGAAAPARAAELRTTLPRRNFPELRRGDGVTKDIAGWIDESYQLARTEGFRDDLPTSSTERQAPELPAAYVASSKAIAEKRLTLASYRLADLLIDLLHD